MYLLSKADSSALKLGVKHIFILEVKKEEIDLLQEGMPPSGVSGRPLSQAKGKIELFCVFTLHKQSLTKHFPL